MITSLAPMARAVRVDESNGSGATDQNPLPKGHSSSSARMHPNGKWFHERALLEADIVRQLVAEVGSMHIVPCKVAVDRRGFAELHARAQVVNPRLAIVAACTGYSWLYSHTVSHLEV